MTCTNPEWQRKKPIQDLAGTFRIINRIDKIVDFYSPKIKVIVTAQIYSTAIEDIGYNDHEK